MKRQNWKHIKIIYQINELVTSWTKPNLKVWTLNNKMKKKDMMDMEFYVRQKLLIFKIKMSKKMVGKNNAIYYLHVYLFTW
jgi:hypothetical protein